MIPVVNRVSTQMLIRPQYTEPIQFCEFSASTTSMAGEQYSNTLLQGVAIHAAIIIVTMFQVSMMRLLTKTGYGIGDDPKAYFTRACRIQIMSVEWSGTFCALFLALQFTVVMNNIDISPWLQTVVHFATIARVAFTAAYLTLPSARSSSLLRATTAVSSYVAATILIIALLLRI